MGLANGLPGWYGVLDGIIGCGKTAQRKELEKHLPMDFPNSDIVFTYEPGGNPEADILRQRVKHEKMSPEEEMQTFVASRSITLPQIVTPVLTRGGVVLSDRSVTTSLAYQAFGRELGLKKVWAANESAVNGIFPDLIVYMNVGKDICFQRSGGEDPDKFDSEDSRFWDRTIHGYDQMIQFMKKISPETKILKIDDPYGKLSIEQMRLIIKENIYPEIRNVLSEGRISREKQI